MNLTPPEVAKLPPEAPVCPSLAQARRTGSSRGPGRPQGARRVGAKRRARRPTSTVRLSRVGDVFDPPINVTLDEANFPLNHQPRSRVPAEPVHRKLSSA